MKKIIYVLIVLAASMSMLAYEENVYGEYFFYCQEYGLSIWLSDGEIYLIEPGLKSKIGNYEILQSNSVYILRIRLNESDEFFINLHWGKKLSGIGIIKKEIPIRYNDGPQIKNEIKKEEIPAKCTLEKIST